MAAWLSCCGLRSHMPYPSCPNAAYLDARRGLCYKTADLGWPTRRLYPLRVRRIFRFLLNSFSISFHAGCTGRCQCHQSPPPPPCRCGSIWPTNACGAATRRGSCGLKLRPPPVSGGTPGPVAHQSDFVEALWPETTVSEVVLSVCMRELRQALGDDARMPRFIETVHRRGYRFIGLPPCTRQHPQRPLPLAALFRRCSRGVRRNWRRCSTVWPQP